jgi:hypothetical protein
VDPDDDGIEVGFGWWQRRNNLLLNQNGEKRVQERLVEAVPKMAEHQHLFLIYKA